MVAGLTRLLGSRHLELAEDVVQEAFLRATREWAFHGIPENPSGWLRRVARNLAIDHLRHQVRAMELLEENAALLRSEWTLASTLDAALAEMKASDDLLRMLFACCHPDLPAEHQVALALKTLCGLSVREIARAFVTKEETIQKRLLRAREVFRGWGRIELPDEDQRASRIDSVLRVVYLLFNEGYFATESDEFIREDLLEEAVRLGELLTREPTTDVPRVHALLALMLFHAARSEARLAADGAIVLLADQDRARWNRTLIAVASAHLARSSVGDECGAYHLEAGIAAVHATALTWAATDWRTIVHLYDQLLHIRPDAVVGINRAVAIGELHGPHAALRELEVFASDGRCLVLFHAARGELLARVGAKDEARSTLEVALGLTRNRAEKSLIQKKLLALGAGDSCGASADR